MANRTCHSCHKQALMLVRVEMFTVYPNSEREPEMVEYKLCLPCLEDSISYMKDIDG